MDLLRYKQLIELEKNNSLSEELYWELLNYDASVVSQINYNRKKEYLLLVDKYCNQQMDSYEFQRLFLIMQKEDSAAAYTIRCNLQTLEIFELTNARSKISDLITDISSLCLDFDAISLETDNEIAKSKIKFDSSVKKHYLNQQKLFPVLSCANLPYEKLILRSFNMLISIIGLEIMLVLAYLLMENCKKNFSDFIKIILRLSYIDF